MPAAPVTKGAKQDFVEIQWTALHFSMVFIFFCFVVSLKVKKPGTVFFTADTLIWQSWKSRDVISNSNFPVNYSTSPPSTCSFPAVPAVEKGCWHWNPEQNMFLYFVFHVFHGWASLFILHCITIYVYAPEHTTFPIRSDSFFTADILTCYSRKSTRVTNNINYLHLCDKSVTVFGAFSVWTTFSTDLCCDEWKLKVADVLNKVILRSIILVVLILLDKETSDYLIRLIIG